MLVCRTYTYTHLKVGVNEITSSNALTAPSPLGWASSYSFSYSSLLFPLPLPPLSNVSEREGPQSPVMKRQGTVTRKNCARRLDWMMFV